MIEKHYFKNHIAFKTRFKTFFTSFSLINDKKKKMR